MIRAFGLALLVLGAAAAITGEVEKSDEKVQNSSTKLGTASTARTIKLIAKLFVVPAMFGAGGADAVAFGVGGTSLKGFGRGVTEVTAVTVGLVQIQLDLEKGAAVDAGDLFQLAKGAVTDAVDQAVGQAQLALEKGGLKSWQGPGGIYETYTAEEIEGVLEGFDAKLTTLAKKSAETEVSMFGFHAKLKKLAQDHGMSRTDLSLAKVAAPAGLFVSHQGAKMQVFGVLKEGGEMMLREGVQKSGWNNPRLGGIMYEIQQMATFNADAVTKGSGLRAHTTASLGNGTNQVADVVVKRRNMVVAEAQMKSGITAAREIQKPQYAGVQHVVPIDQVAKSGANGRAALKHARVSAQPLDNPAILNLTSKVRQDLNPLASHSKASVLKNIKGFKLQSVGKNARLAGGVVFVAGAAWSLRENYVAVAQGEKTVGKAAIAVALDVSGVGLAIDAHNWAKKKLISQ